MHTKRTHIDYLDAKRSEILQAFAAKLAVLILIAVVPGGFPLALSAYIYQRGKRSTSAAPVHRWPTRLFRAGASLIEKRYRALQHWKRAP
jgi:hypothetical protein